MKYTIQILFFIFAMLSIGHVKAAGTIYDESNHEICFIMGAQERLYIKGNNKAAAKKEYEKYLQEGNRRWKEDPYFNSKLCEQSINQGIEFANELQLKVNMMRHQSR